ncbi:MAG: DUF362 domain-containing protein [bacterium]|nr:DUF362 domain-containing protein [bacterium]
MPNAEKGMTRRDFVVAGSGVALAGMVGVAGPKAEAAAANNRVVLVRDGGVLDEAGQPRNNVLQKMLNDAMERLLDVNDAKQAWKQIIRPEDIVGIKTNVWGRLPTPPVLEQYLRTQVIRAGVTADNVAVDDRGVRKDPVFQRATALINVRPMRTHAWSGLGTCLKNHIMFVERPSDYHGDACADLGAVWELPQVKGKTRLNILVMLTPQFHGEGPHSYSEEFVWRYNGLIVGIAPVPVDAIGAQIIEAKREDYFGTNRPISPSPHHIQIAGSKYGLGESDPAKIDLIRLGDSEGSLI